MIRDGIFLMLVVISLVDIIISLCIFEKQFLANVLRPAVVVLLFRT